MPKRFAYFTTAVFVVLTGLFLANTSNMPSAEAASSKVRINSSVTVNNTDDFPTSNIYEVSGDLTFTTDFKSTSLDKILVIFVTGNLAINKNISHPDKNSGVVFVVKGDVNIAQNVTQIDAAIISSGTICTAYDTIAANCPSINVPGSQPLVVNGSLISIKQSAPSDPVPPIQFKRSLSDNTNPAETIIYQPKYLVILRGYLADTYQRWSEIQ